VKARIHAGEGGTYLWVANPTRQAVPVRIDLGPAWGPFHAARSLHGAEAAIDGRMVTMIAGARENWLVVDSSKFTQRSFVKLADWPAITHLVTDAGISKQDREWTAGYELSVHLTSV
jgi:hypothetical protein